MSNKKRKAARRLVRKKPHPKPMFTAHKGTRY